jgi:D-galactose 1-dehydrogenase
LRAPLALAGIGKIARDQHVPALAASPDWALAATVSRSGRVDGVEGFADMASFLAARPEVGAVSLALPPQPRFPYAEAALKAGRHVMLEKPPGQTLAEVHVLERLARERGVTLYATWHSRMGKGVAAARAWLAGRAVRGGRVTWKEDVRHWHPGQDWVFEPGGMGVFDPGINALSVLTAILPEPVHLTGAELDVPANRQTPIAARLEFTGGIAMELDWLHPGEPLWDIEIEAEGGRLLLREGGNRLFVDGEEREGSAEGEYPALYRRFAELVRAGESEVDLEPMVHVADALALGRRRMVEAFDF